MDNITFLKQKLNLDKFEDYLRFPRYYEIETVNACNATCKMCTVNKWQTNGNPFMSDMVFRKMADELIDNRDIVRTVNLSRDGEPLLDRKLEERITYLKEGGINHITFSTNASLLTKKRALSLMKSGLDEIMFSIDGLKKETFEKIRTGLNFEKIMNNVSQFIKLRDSTVPSVKIRVRMVIQQDNLAEIEEWGKYWRSILQKQDSVHAKNIHSWANKLGNYVAVKEMSKLYTPCTSPFSTMIIRYNGDVTICPLDYDFKYVNGNIGECSIKDIWQSGAYFRNFRELHLQGKRDEFAFCTGCRLWDSEESKRSFN
ncbi:radical SAM protein [uncultured Candidatus Kuenenia sp.]|uniref:radical SAM/SPASM domain-containing protein n=1 Tax=uncultured Candidatus Kuenenia sp. TaxID=1048336 RepID=UPI00031E16D6|nr:radical SAM protein [uncultured Candidatus Kuenenia sp.]